MDITVEIQEMGEAISKAVEPLVYRDNLIGTPAVSADLTDVSYFMFYKDTTWKYVSIVELEKNIRGRKQKTYEAVLSTTVETNTLAISENIADIQAITLFIKTATQIVPPGLTGPSYGYNFVVANQLITLQMEGTALATLGGGTLVVTITRR